MSASPVSSPDTLSAERVERIGERLAAHRRAFQARELTSLYCEENFLSLLGDALVLCKAEARARSDLATARAERPDLWSFARRCIQVGLDMSHEVSPTYEEHSAKLDARARDLADSFA